jgi:hypothetical protein
LIWNAKKLTKPEDLIRDTGISKLSNLVQLVLRMQGGAERKLNVKLII